MEKKVRSVHPLLLAPRAEHQPEAPRSHGLNRVLTHPDNCLLNRGVRLQQLLDETERAARRGSPPSVRKWSALLRVNEGRARAVEVFTCAAAPSRRFQRRSPFCRQCR